MKKHFYYEIAVGSLSLKDTGVFTYFSNESLSTGQIVEVELKRNLCLGVVIKTTKKPNFKSKQIEFVSNDIIPESLVKLLLWSIEFYPGESGSLIKLFLPPGVYKKPFEAENKVAQTIDAGKEQLTKDQINAVDLITKNHGVSLLHGDTGTGKTRVYVELIKKSIMMNKSVLVLCPEIGLSEQVQAILSKNFSNIISYHSLYTVKQRKEKWTTISRNYQPQIIIGPRSALFTPINNLGLIIIDEAHDSAYKQLQSPYYTTLQMATKLAQLANAQLVYGSATPNTADYFSAELKGFPIIKMNERPVANITKNTIDIKTLDSKDKKHFKRNNFISDEAIDLIRTACKKGMQSLILLNRRGTAQLLQCETCLWQYRCPTCEHTLVYHKDIHKAVCHFCGKENSMLTICPEDEGPIKQLSIGTKYIEESCKALFPTEIIQRIDRDSVERETIKETMDFLSKGDARILVGTQLLAKGLDLPLLSTIVVLDASPKSSDFLGDERYYQLLHQVIGRGMRGHQNTKILIQTPNTEDPIIDWSTKDQWKEFYKHELAERKKYRYPPFVQLGVIKYSRKNQESAERIYKKITDTATKSKIDIELLGPLPTRSNIKNMTTWVILIKAKKRVDIISAAKLAPKDATIDYDPISTI